MYLFLEELDLLEGAVPLPGKVAPAVEVQQEVEPRLQLGGKRVTSDSTGRVGRLTTPGECGGKWIGLADVAQADQVGAALHGARADDHVLRLKTAVDHVAVVETGDGVEHHQANPEGRLRTELVVRLPPQLVHIRATERLHEPGHVPGTSIGADGQEVVRAVPVVAQCLLEFQQEPYLILNCQFIGRRIEQRTWILSLVTFFVLAASSSWANSGRRSTTRTMLPFLPL